MNQQKHVFFKKYSIYIINSGLQGGKQNLPLVKKKNKYRSAFKASNRAKEVIPTLG
jgi:hypothetical protein